MRPLQFFAVEVDMELKEIAALGGVGLLLTLIQISPIKIDPWTAIWKLIKKGLRAVGRAINSEVMEEVKAVRTDLTAEVQAVRADLSAEVTEVKTDLSSVKDTVAAVQTNVVEMGTANEEQAMINARARILRFGDELLHKVRHSKDHFDSVLKDAKTYENYCREHQNFENGVTEPTIQRIRDVYDACLESNDFL